MAKSNRRTAGTAPQLRIVVNAETGEVVEQDERDLLIEELKNDVAGARLQIGKLKRELRDLRSVDPESQSVREVLTYWQERCSPTSVIAPGGKRWEKVRARLKDKLDGRDPWTPAELKLAVDGALLDPWLSGRDRRSKGYLDAETIFRDAEQVEKLRNLAVGFEAKAGIGLGDLLDVAPSLRWVDWKQLLAVCTCSHRRIEHHPGFESCTRCDCLGYSLDVFEPVNQQLDPELKRLMSE